jgi:hypothetical protein
MEADAVGDAGGTRVFVGLVDEFAVDVDAETAGAEVACSGDDDAAVARTQVNYDVVRAHFGHTQHFFDGKRRRRQVGRGDVERRLRRCGKLKAGYCCAN